MQGKDLEKNTRRRLERDGVTRKQKLIPFNPFMYVLFRFAGPASSAEARAAVTHG